jgi:transcriptional regulator with XRE-family HTH domain
MTDMDGLSEKLKELRRKKGWTQEDVARELYVSLSTIQCWEKKGGVPTRLARRELQRLFRREGIALNS